MAGRNYQGVMQNDPNLMWNLGPMFQGVNAMSDRRHSMNRQRRQNYIQDRMDMGLDEQPYEDDMYSPQPNQSMLQGYLSRQQPMQQEQQKNLNFGLDDNPISKYAIDPNSGTVLDMTPQKSNIQLLADRYADYMAKSTDPSQIKYNERKTLDYEGNEATTFDEDPDNAYNKQFHDNMAELGKMFNPQRMSQGRTVDDQMWLDNNRAANSQIINEQKYNQQNQLAQAKLNYMREAQKNGIDAKTAELTWKLAMGGMNAFKSPTEQAAIANQYQSLMKTGGVPSQQMTLGSSDTTTGTTTNMGKAAATSALGGQTVEQEDPSTFEETGEFAEDGQGNKFPIYKSPSGKIWVNANGKWGVLGGKKRGA